MLLCHSLCATPLLLAAQYGKRLVPFGKDRMLLSYLPGKRALELVGVVEAARIPMHMLLEVCTPWGLSNARKDVAVL